MAEETTQKIEGDGGVKKAPPTFRFLLGEKVGMTQVFDKTGVLCGATVVKAGPCPVMRVKRADGPDGYWAVQLAFGVCKEKNLPKPLLGQFKAAGVNPARYVREFRVPADPKIEPGQTVVLDAIIKAGDYLDVRGTSKGHGFAGVMKRHNFRGMPASHGASDKQRSPGSLAARRSLGRVLPGQRMAGHMGVEQVCVHKAEVIKIDAEKNLVYLKSSVPGPRGGLVMLCETVKSKKFRTEKIRSTIRKDKMGNIITVAKRPTKAKPQ
ncbi:MAG: 50S ribosomal protein L3 [Elusimicrobia bacterium]|nr:50S ribosomal protein L3 [Elusimicrobiota bacterium]